MNCAMLADLFPYFHRLPTKLCSDLVSFACWIVPKFWAFARKSDLIVHALNCARFAVICALNCAKNLVVRALDCALFVSSVSFAPCPFPNLAGTLQSCMFLLHMLNNYDNDAAIFTAA